MGPGQALQAGRRRWHALAAPGHDPHSLVLFDDQTGVLISADALWENGFGVVFPELEGEDAFDEVARVLDLIESLGAHWVIPGHGAPFMTCNAALQRARRRLESFRSDPARHARHAAKVWGEIPPDGGTAAGLGRLPALVHRDRTVPVDLAAADRPEGTMRRPSPNAWWPNCWRRVRWRSGTACCTTPEPWRQCSTFECAGLTDRKPAPARPTQDHGLFHPLPRKPP